MIWPTTPREALGHGIALVPEDRKTQGLVLGRTAVDNIVMTDYRKVSRCGVLLTRAMQTETRNVAREFGFSERRINDLMRNLSGGNQQKMLLGKWFYRKPKILLVDEPTRGIDIGAKEEIMVTLRQLADQGLGIMVVSSELEEVVDLSDQILVLSSGRSVANLVAGRNEISVQAILNAAFEIHGDKNVSHKHIDNR
jgi:ABC-type sugar transport system ATPase subunit